MDTYIEAAFHKLCESAEPAAVRYVSLYRDDRFYGGPEEGGWYGTDTELVAHQATYSQESAEKLLASIKELADKLTAQAEESRNRHLAAECEWLEERGLEDSFLPEPDGGERFWVCVEEKLGSNVSTGDRFYS